MKGVIGIYDAGLGNKSNETSGKAIIARQREGDVGTAIYSDNWSRSIQRTGSILIDLFPHVYDTERMIRIMGEDGKVDLKWINKPTGMQEIDPDTGMPSQTEKIENDVTVGAYDVVLETGPSFTTKREEAKESMKEFMQSAPEASAVVMDLYAKAQDWPLADEIGKRFEVMAPPPIQQLLAKQKQESGEEEQPNPMQMQAQQAAQMQQQAQQEAMRLEFENKQLANDKIRAEIAKIAKELNTPTEIQAPQVNPAEAMAQQQEMEAKQQDAQFGQVERAHKMRSAEHEFQHKTRMSDLEYQHSQQDLAGKQRKAQQEEADSTPNRNAELIAAINEMAQAIKGGMDDQSKLLTELAKALTAPKKVIRDQRNQVIGVERVGTGLPPEQIVRDGNNQITGTKLN
jgi:hypothetical protein